MTKKIIYILLLIANISFANVTLPSLFSDHMVLQQNEDVKFWGWANPSEEIVIKPSWTQETYKVKANNLAEWKLFIKTPKYGGPFIITITGNNEIVLNDVLIGEIWLCSGQSNMEMSAAWGIKDGDEEIAKANNSNIRFFTIDKTSARYPQNNLFANWNVCTPETMKNSSAVAYFFAQGLQNELKEIPIGLIVSAWGGTPAEIWMQEDVIKNNVVLFEAANKLTPVEWGPTKPARAFNAMINPLIGYNIAGALWYQGEANVGATNYDQTLSALIDSWRTLWKKKFPFYFVQIAPYNYGENHFGGVEIRNAQRKVADTIQNTAMVIITDISTSEDIHPKNKKPVGSRLANLALKNHYHVIDGLVESPSFSKATFQQKKAIVYFNYAEGLYQKGNASLFEIAGEDRVFYTGKSKINGDAIIVSSKKVKTPKYIRFAWGNTLQSNLFNKSNLPASSFTTEN
tara:strand:- start:56955 stop:58328 length:1374 start_codon:yes stop_codon:yes gene_type:complete